MVLSRAIAIFAVTASLALPLAACSGKSGPASSGEAAKPARMTLDVVVLDDKPDPFAKLPDGAPKGLSTFQEIVVMGPEAVEVRTFVRLVVQPGETLAQAQARAKPWFDKVALPPGDRLVFQQIEEENEVTKQREAVGVRTFIATSQTVLTQDDVGDATLGAAPDENQKPQPVANLLLKPDAAQRFQKFTKENALKRIAVIVDGNVLMSARIQEEITGGQLSISLDPDTPYEIKRLRLQSVVDGLKPKAPGAATAK
jgi:hypothetical protein